MNLGTKIVRSCELIENMWAQIEALRNSLTAMTESALKKGDFENVQSAGRSTSTSDIGPSGWSYLASADSFPVMQKRRRKTEPTAWLNYQISMFGSGIPALESAGQETTGPVLHISFWHQRIDFTDPQLCVMFPSEWEEYEIKDRRLIFWASETDGEYPQWTFSIRLLELNNEVAIEDSVLTPIKKLLAGEAPDTALPANLPGLVFYTLIEHGEDGRDIVASESSFAST